MANAFRVSHSEARQLGLIDQEAPYIGPRPLTVVKQSPEDDLDDQLRFFTARGLKVVRQLQFAKAAMGRRWAFDFAFPDYMVATEIEGLVPVVMWRAKLDGAVPRFVSGYATNVISCNRTPAVLGRHASISGIKEDMVKYNAAAELGWSVLRFEQKDVKPRRAIETILRVLATRGWRAP